MMYKEGLITENGFFIKDWKKNNPTASVAL